MTKWLADYVRPTLDQSTAISFEGEVRLHVAPMLGSIPLRDLRPEQLARFYATKAQSLAQSHVLYLHRTMHKALNTALRWSLVPRNVADAVDAPRARRAERPVLSEEQVGEPPDALGDDRL